MIHIPFWKRNGKGAWDCLLPKEVMENGEPSQVSPVEFFRFGRGATILDPSTLPDIRFYHHVLQEYWISGIFRGRPAYLVFGVKRIVNLLHIWRCITPLPRETDILLHLSLQTFTPT